MKKILIIINLICVLSVHASGQDSETYRKFASFDFQKITEKLFEAKAIRQNEFVWKPNYAELFDFSETVSFDGNCHTVLDTAIDIKGAGVHFIVLAYTTIKYTSKDQIQDCHNCAPIVSVAFFRKEGDNSYTLENFKKAFRSFGEFGESGTFSVEKIGRELFALVLQSGYMGQGQYNETKDFYLVTSGPFLEKIFSFESENSNNNSGEKETVSLKIQSQPADQYAYDFILTSKKNGKISPIKRKYSYSEENNRYRLTK